MTLHFFPDHIFQMGALQTFEITRHSPAYYPFDKAKTSKFPLIPAFIGNFISETGSTMTASATTHSCI
jgi:hypothetical protein